MTLSMCRDAACPRAPLSRTGMPPTLIVSPSTMSALPVSVAAATESTRSAMIDSATATILAARSVTAMRDPSKIAFSSCRVRLSQWPGAPTGSTCQGTRSNVYDAPHALTPCAA